MYSLHSPHDLNLQAVELIQNEISVEYATLGLYYDYYESRFIWESHIWESLEVPASHHFLDVDVPVCATDHCEGSVPFVVMQKDGTWTFSEEITNSSVSAAFCMPLASITDLNGEHLSVRALESEFSSKIEYRLLPWNGTAALQDNTVEDWCGNWDLAPGPLNVSRQQINMVSQLRP